MKTITYVADEATQKFASDAIAVQDAVNFGAVVRSLVRHLDAIERADSDSQMKHPAATYFVDKLAEMSGIQGLGSGRASECYDHCKKLANGEDVTITVIPYCG